MGKSVALKQLDRLIPTIRAWVAIRLVNQGFKVRDVARVLGLTPSAVTQYVKGKRGAGMKELAGHENLLNQLVEKAAARIKSGGPPIEPTEISDIAYQISGAAVSEVVLESVREPRGERRWLRLLRERLQTELMAAQRCLELASRVEDDFSKLLLRMIASDSIRHADIISLVISSIESGGKFKLQLPDLDFISGMLEIETKSLEFKLKDEIDIPHPVAKLLLESIDMDETKHETILAKLVSIAEQISKRKRVNQQEPPRG